MATVTKVHNNYAVFVMSDNKQQTQLYNDNLIKFCSILRLSTKFVDQQIGVLNLLNLRFTSISFNIYIGIRFLIAVFHTHSFMCGGSLQINCHPPEIARYEVRLGQVPMLSVSLCRNMFFWAVFKCAMVHAHGHVLTTVSYAGEMCAGKAALSEL